ncbi:MAG: hypothetical protein U1E46_12385 [Hyphomicrobiales bacterium]
MEIPITIGALLAGSLLVTFAAIRERRPRTSFDVSMIPTTAIMFLGGFLVLVALVHLVNLAGLHTGRGP